jgi:hypothetical protein
MSRVDCGTPDNQVGKVVKRMIDNVLKAREQRHTGTEFTGCSSPVKQSTATTLTSIRPREEVKLSDDMLLIEPVHAHTCDFEHLGWARRDINERELDATWVDSAGLGALRQILLAFARATLHVVYSGRGALE